MNDNILEQALEWAKKHHPNAPMAHQCAFANSVQYFCTGWSGGYGGPSVREHACSHALVGANGKTAGVQTNVGGLTMLFPDGSLPTPGNWGFEAACKFAEPICLGTITRLHFDCYRTENCFDDAPEDLLALQTFRQRT